MDNVLNLTKYRQGKRKDWLSKHSTQLDRFMTKFIAANISMDYLQVSSYFQAQHQQNSEESWDYSELRDKIRDAIDHMVGEGLYQALSKQWWFEAMWISKEDAVDRCLSIYILDSLSCVAGEQ
jgi:hypothetical protein